MQTGHDLVRNREGEREIEPALGEVGLTRKKIAQTPDRALDAKVTKVFCNDGELIYSEPLEDHPTQVRAAEVAGELYGDFPTMRTIERWELLYLQQNIVVVPGGMPTKEDKEKKVRQLAD